jgi:hypothetical protein
MPFTLKKSLAWTLLLMGGGVFGFLVFGPQALLAQVAGDGAPPKISNIQFTVVNATTTLVTWETDEDADSEVNYGLNKNYGIARDPLPNKKKHQLKIEDLEPSTTYNFRVGSQDYAGNQALSGNYIFTTKSVINIKDKEKMEKIPPEERAIVEQAITAIRKLKTVEGLKIVAEELQDVAETLIEPPRIIGTPHVEEIGTDYAVISWPTDVDSGTVVRYAREEDYRPDSDEPYTTEAGDRTERVKEHELKIIGLSPGTTYHFMAESEGEFDLTGVSRDGTFQTKAALPAILNFRVMKVQEDSAVLTWRTNFPAAGTVEYTNMKTKQAKSAGDPILAASHQVTLPSLALGQRYMAIVKAENSVGDKVVSNPIYFTTVKDIAAPLISKVSNESTLYPSADAKVQTIISWDTDEPAFCQLWYREGLAPTIEPIGFGEEKDAREDHVQVIVEFLPSTVYQYWVECRDPSKNATKSENFVLFTPNKEKSIIDIILENFEGTFGWVKNIGK